jgi:thiol-disulfide isomerase/thioredoxin
MLTRRTLLLAMGGAMLTPSSLRAAQRMKYDAAAFQAAQEAGKSILVHITAPWCGECKLQKPIVQRLSELPDFMNLVIVEIDFDSQKDAVKAVKARKQSTLIAFKGKQETGRAVGISRQAKIEAVMRKAL